MFSRIAVINLIVLTLSVIAVSSKKIYYIENEKFLDWNNANLACRKIGFNLLSIRSRDELNSLKERISKEYGRILPFWLGAYRINGQYEWRATGERITQYFWHQGEPNDKSGQENCVHTWEGDFDWNDNDCELKLPFICELEV